MNSSNYVCAGFETLATIVDNFIKNKKGDFNENFTRQDVSKFFSQTCNKFLHSFGQNFRNKKKYDNYINQEAAVYENCKSTGIFNNSEFYIDSGGFQISVGLLDEKETNILIDLYYKFLREKHNVIDKAFILDIPPGPNCKAFKSFKDVYEWNLSSYQTAASLPDEIRKKIVYIHHFRTPQLWQIYNKILREDKMFPNFDFHGTGGIIANMSSDIEIPCIIYVIPLIPLINEALKYGRTKLYFHVLGGANYRDILFYELFKIHVLKEHNLELEITYDSSGLFKGLMIGRFIHVLHDNIIKKVDIRSECIFDGRFHQEKKVIDILRERLNILADTYGFKRIPINEVYNQKTGTFFEDVKVYLMFYMLSIYKLVEEKMKKIAQEIYPMYESGELNLFNNTTELITKNLNAGKLTKKQKTKTYSVSLSLDMLKNLDEEYCEYLVTQSLAKDEFIELFDKLDEQI